MYQTKGKTRGNILWYYVRQDQTCEWLMFVMDIQQILKTTLPIQKPMTKNKNKLWSINKHIEIIQLQQKQNSFSKSRKHKKSKHLIVLQLSQHFVLLTFTFFTRNVSTIEQLNLMIILQFARLFDGKIWTTFWSVRIMSKE